MVLLSEKESVKKEIDRMDKHIQDMSKQELKEIVLINSYKLALMRSQIESLTEILIKNNLTTYEDVWKKTNMSFKDIKM